MIPDVVREAVDEAKRNAPAFRSDAWPHTELDVLGTPAQSASGVCVRGYTVAKLHETTHAASVAHGRCKGGSCPACIGFYLSDRIARVWQYKFNGAETLYRYTTTQAEFRAKRNRVKGHWWIRQADGTLHVFTTDPTFPDVVEVPAIPALLQSLLSAPAVMPKKAKGQKTENRHSPAPKHPQPEQDPEVSVWRVPKGILPQDTLQRFRERLNAAGLPVPEWSMRTGPFTYAAAVKYTAKLTPAQAEVFRLVYGEYHEQAVDDFWDMLHAVNERRRERKFHEAHPLPDNPTAMELLDAAYDLVECRVQSAATNTAVLTQEVRQRSTQAAETREARSHEERAASDAYYCEFYGCTLDELRDLQDWEGWVDGHPPQRIPASAHLAERKRHERYLLRLRAGAWNLARRETDSEEAFYARLHELDAEIDRLESLGLTYAAEAAEQGKVRC